MPPPETKKIPIVFAMERTIYKLLHRHGCWPGPPPDDDVFDPTAPRVVSELLALVSKDSLMNSLGDAVLAERLTEILGPDKAIAINVTLVDKAAVGGLDRPINTRPLG